MIALGIPSAGGFALEVAIAATRLVTLADCGNGEILSLRREWVALERSERRLPARQHLGFGSSDNGGAGREMWLKAGDVDAMTAAVRTECEDYESGWFAMHAGPSRPTDGSSA